MVKQSAEEMGARLPHAMHSRWKREPLQTPPAFRRAPFYGRKAQRTDE
jgi:hypothetical protein